MLWKIRFLYKVGFLRALRFKSSSVFLNMAWMGNHTSQFVWLLSSINSLRPRQNGRQFADDIFKCIFLIENVWFPIKISLNFVPKGIINNNISLVQIMAWRRPGDKPLSEPMIVSLPTHICLARPQWVNNKRSFRVWSSGNRHHTPLGWGLLSQFPPFRYFPNFSSLSKHTLTVKYRIYIWQVSPQLSCGDTCQIWMWFDESNMYFCEIENFAYGEINERSFSNPHPRPVGRGGACDAQAPFHHSFLLKKKVPQIKKGPNI